MFNVSKYTASPTYTWILAGICLFVVLLCIIIFAKRGLIKDIFGLAYLGLLIFVCIKFGPMLKEWVISLGFLPEKILNISQSTIAGIITYLVIFIVWLIVKGIINAIFKKAFNYEKRVFGFFGILLSIPFALVLCFIICQTMTTSYLFYGSEKTKKNIAGYEYIDTNVINLIEDICEDMKIPGSFEGIIVNKTAKVGTEEYEAYMEKFENIEAFRANPEYYMLELGELNDEKVTEVIATFNDVFDCVINFNNKKIANVVLVDATNFINEIAPNVYSVGNERSRLINSMLRLGVSDQVLETTSTVLK